MKKPFLIAMTGLWILLLAWFLYRPGAEQVKVTEWDNPNQPVALVEREYTVVVRDWIRIVGELITVVALPGVNIYILLKRRKTQQGGRR